MEELLEEYYKIGSKACDITPYVKILNLALEFPGKVILHSGLVPWPFASLAVTENMPSAVKQCHARKYIHKDDIKNFTEKGW
jgi:hypothetical protein